MNRTKSKLLTALLTLSAVGFGVMLPGVASALTLGQIFNNINQSIQGAGQLAGAIGYAVSFFFLLGAIFKFKAYGENPEQNPIRTPIFLVITAVLGVYMTAVLTTGGETVFGGSRSTQGADGSRITSGIQ